MRYYFDIFVSKNASPILMASVTRKGTRFAQSTEFNTECLYFHKQVLHMNNFVIDQGLEKAHMRHNKQFCIYESLICSKVEMPFDI